MKFTTLCFTHNFLISSGSCSNLLRCPRKNLTLQDKFRRTCLLLDAFRNLAKFLKNSTQSNTKDEDLLFVVALLKLDDGLAWSHCWSAAQYFSIF